MNLSKLFGTGWGPEEVCPDGKNHFLVKLPAGEVRIHAEVGTNPTYVITSSSVAWNGLNSTTLTEEDKKLAIEKTCDFIRRRRRTVEVDNQRTTQ